ncbi:uncharacterized protein [Linepithema humile]|uniref:uncharacterized protein n=1 Tax=Linepithema humile TaxID=83485 RepID=UPI0006234766|nr:PREDICTED: ribonuclease H-like [Linepithema humile]
MPYYAVANGRTTGVFDNWEDCKKQVDGYSYNDYRRFETPNAAWDYVDQNSSHGQSFTEDFSNPKAIACGGKNNQVALRGNCGEARAYQRTDYVEGKNVTMVRERTCTSGRSGNGYYVEQRVRTYWENRK